MKLALQSEKKNKKETVAKVVKSKKVKKATKGKTVGTAYKSMDSRSIDNESIDLSKLNYGIINDCDLEKLILADGEIKLQNSWTEAVIFLISCIIEQYPDSFKQELMNFGITHDNFTVDTFYGKIAFESSKYQKVYQIYNTKYYLEAIFNIDNIYNAITGSVKCLGIAPKGMQLFVRNRKQKQAELTFGTVNSNEIIVNIIELLDKLKSSNGSIASFELFDTTYKLKSIVESFVIFCNVMYEHYGKDIANMDICGNTWIGFNDEATDIQSMAIKDGICRAYSDGNEDDMLALMISMINKLGLDSSIARYKISTIEMQVKPWDID